MDVDILKNTSQYELEKKSDHSILQICYKYFE